MKLKWIKSAFGWRSEESRGEVEIRARYGRRDGRVGPANQRLGWIVNGQRFKYLKDAKAYAEASR